MRLSRAASARICAGFAQAFGGALGGDGFALAAHAGDGGGEGGFGQAEALDTDLANFDAVEAAQRGGELGLQAGFESRQLHLRRIGVHQIGEVDAAGGDLERGPGEAAELAGGFVGIVAHGADELFDVGRVVRDLPGDEGLHEDAQAIPGADILQAGRGGAQAQIHRDGGFNRGGNFPGEAGLANDAHGAAEFGDDHGGAGADHDGGGGEHRAGEDQRGDAEAERQAGGGGRRGGAVMMVVMAEIERAVIVRGVGVHAHSSLPVPAPVAAEKGRRSSTGASGQFRRWSMMVFGALARAAVRAAK